MQVNLFKSKKSKKPTVSEIRKKERLLKLAATTQNTIKYTSNFEDGLMHIVEDEYSKMYELGELDYEIANEEDQLNTVISYADALNSLDKNARYQLLVINKRIDSSLLENILFDFNGDENDIYRSEMNQIISNHFSRDQKNFEIKKYAIFSSEADSPKKASRQLNRLYQNFAKRFNENGVNLGIKESDGTDRLKVMSELLRPNQPFTFNYQDLAISGLTTKSFISPNRIQFFEEHFKIDDKFGKVLYIRDYPKNLEDQLIRDICDTGLEVAIAIHAKPYDMAEAKNKLNSIKIMNKADIAKQQKENFIDGLSEDMVSGVSTEVKEASDGILNEIKDNGQKLFSGIFTVMVLEDSKEAMEAAVKEVKDTVSTWSVTLEALYQMQEEGLNTILPIGKPYCDIERNYMRDMVTSNIATQIPFTNVDLQSPKGKFYGINQMSQNLITLNRKQDLITPSGLILGSSGSGKGMNTKYEIISNRLSNPNDIHIIVDPESEYLPIAKAFGAQILNIYPGTQSHLNILDMVDRSLLDAEDRELDLVKEKTNLLASLFESVLKSFSDAEASIVDRVTRLTYERFEKPTLVEWQAILDEQPGELAEEFALKVEPYTIGSQNIFAHETNIDLTSNFILFNIKRLDARLKPFAMKVILDQIWKQVVANQGKLTTWLYFDELQINFDTEENAKWFSDLWARVRKYGAIPTGITQNISTLLLTTYGEKMISNTEFIILLRQKLVDLQHLQQVMKLPKNLLKYVGETVPQGTGLISAGGVVVPFKNPIPKDTKLFEIMNTDAK